MEEKNRYDAVDVLRGLALVGVFIVNAATINGPFWMDASDFAFQKTPLDTFMTKLSFTLLVEKCYPIFVFLFGLGISLMLKNRNTRQCYWLHCTRMLTLAVFGFLHVILFFWGDILLTYALVGILLTPLLTQSRKVLFSAMGILTLLSVAIRCILYSEGESGDYSDLMVQVYSQSNFLTILKQRLLDYYEWYYWGIWEGESLVEKLEYLIYYIEILGLMLFGLATGKSQIFSRARKTFWKLLALSCLLLAVLSLLSGYEWVEVFSFLKKVCFLVLYASGFAILYPKISCFTRPVAFMGRMTLTWYLFFSCLMSFVLHGYGLGLYGKIGPSETTSIALAYTALTLAISPLWIGKFRRGPLEKIWRLRAIHRQ